MPEQTANVARGPFFFENWKAALQNQEILGCYECPLYSDAWMVGEEELGPYWFMNTVAQTIRADRDLLAPVFVLRVHVHTQLDEPPMDKKDTSTYHGGWFSDEVAALAALAMGARVQAGPVTRKSRRGMRAAGQSHTAVMGLRSCCAANVAALCLGQSAVTRLRTLVGSTGSRRILGTRWPWSDRHGCIKMRFGSPTPNRPWPGFC
jgi:hypothetical protein